MAKVTLVFKTIMCLFPRLILNRKYLPTKKNNFNPPPLTDERFKYVSVGCGKCIECKNQKAREWQVRLNEELKVNKYAYFVTLTFSNDSLKELCNETQQNESNYIAGLAVRRFLERWRKMHGKSLRHWLITELGHANTERIHLHGIIFANDCIKTELLEYIWKYGNIYVGDYCNERTINYVIKYVTKIDTDHKNYESQIFCSSGIGNNFCNSSFARRLYKYNEEETITYYTLPNGSKVNLPIYYRNKFFTEQERELLWGHLIDKHERYVLGIKIENIDTDEGEKLYNEILQNARQRNMECGYGDDSEEWKKQNYNITMRMLNRMNKTRDYYALKRSLEN